MSLSNQSQHTFWKDPAISLAAIFVTGDYVIGPDESHYSEHRYIISAYVLKYTTLLDDPFYYLEDRYLTVNKYDLEKANVLVAEKREVIRRLRRIRSAAK